MHEVLGCGLQLRSGGVQEVVVWHSDDDVDFCPSQPVKPDERQ